MLGLCGVGVLLFTSCSRGLPFGGILVGSVVLGLRCGDGFTVHVDCLLSACGLFPFER